MKQTISTGQGSVVPGELHQPAVSEPAHVRLSDRERLWIVVALLGLTLIVTLSTVSVLSTPHLPFDLP